jgi:hypothetical protein
MRRRAIPQQPALFPKSVPPGLNYAVVTGTLISDPMKDKGPGGEPLTILEIKFPLAHPERTRSCCGPMRFTTSRCRRKSAGGISRSCVRVPRCSWRASSASGPTALTSRRR